MNAEEISKYLKDLGDMAAMALDLAESFDARLARIEKQLQIQADE